MATFKKYFSSQSCIVSVTEHEYNVFGETGAEVCAELSILCPAIARAVCRQSLWIKIKSK